MSGVGDTGRADAEAGSVVRDPERTKRQWLILSRGRG